MPDKPAPLLQLVSENQGHLSLSTDSTKCAVHSFGGFYMRFSVGALTYKSLNFCVRI